MLTQERGPACARPRSLRYLQSFDERGYLLLVVLAIVLVLKMIEQIAKTLAHMTQSAVKSHNGPADRLQSVGGACR